MVSAQQTPTVTQEMSARLNLKAHVLWVDPSWNLKSVNSLEGVRALVDRAANAKIHTIILDVKPITGEVIFKSQVARPFADWRGVNLSPDFDVLKAMTEAAHARGLELYASFNTFTEGHRQVERGKAYDKKRWQVQYLVPLYRITLPNGEVVPLAETDEEVLDKPSGWFVTKGKATAAKDSGVRFFIFGADGVLIGPVDAASQPDGGFPYPAGGYALGCRGSLREYLDVALKPGDRIGVSSEWSLITSEAAPVKEAGLFVNPALPEVRNYQLNLIREVVQNYDVDGIVLDRMRYPSPEADFSEASRYLFEQQTGANTKDWPECVLKPPSVPNGEAEYGPLWGKWQQWRAKQIHDFVVDIRERVLPVKPKIKLAAYVGSWYGNYAGVGVEWGNDLTHAPYTWANDDYRINGFAGLMDWLTTGCYYKWPTMAEARENGAPAGASVEAAAQLSVTGARDACWVYPGIYVLDFKGDPNRFKNAISQALKNGQGIMIFDSYYLDEYNWWGLLSESLNENERPPHLYPALLEQARDIRDRINPR
ncbi:MAG: alpha amylase family protein [Armatimonadota bacterium]